MTQKVHVVEGRQFRTEADYRRALRDKQIIDQLRQKVDFHNRSQLTQLVKSLQQNRITFLTILGQDFVDEVEETLNKLSESPSATGKGKRNGQAIKSGKNKRGQNSGRDGNTGPRKIAGETGQEEQLEKFVQEELKRRERRRRQMALLCSLVAVCCLGYFGIYTYQAVRTEREFARLAAFREHAQDMPLVQGTGGSPEIHYTEDGERVIPEVLDEYKNLYNSNKRLIGWLKIDDTKIDYPVMQTSNNEYFLNHNINQQSDRNGALFLDKDCDVLTPSTNLIIYGHHMRSGNMFGTLDKYSSEQYYKEHPLIQFDSIYEKGTYEIMYVFRSRIYNEEDVVFKYYQFIDALNQQEFDSNMEEMAAMSLYDTGVTASYGDHLLTLSTCDYYVD
ncbi:MAG: class B sortase, partial [Acetatifactor sp.]|nr:class B sortase [Acetatifactor sp.]